MIIILNDHPQGQIELNDHPWTTNWSSYPQGLKGQIIITKIIKTKIRRIYPSTTFYREQNFRFSPNLRARSKNSVRVRSGFWAIIFWPKANPLKRTASKSLKNDRLWTNSCQKKSLNSESQVREALTRVLDEKQHCEKAAIWEFQAPEEFSWSLVLLFSRYTLY